MMFRSSALRPWLVVLGLSAGIGAAVVAPGCGSKPADVKVAGPSAALPADLLAKSWPVQMATPAAQSKLTSASGAWIPFVMKRELRGAVQSFGMSGGLAAARAHAEAASMYRQAALMTAYSYIETYGKTPAETDPLGTAHVLAVSYALIGDLDSARAQSKRLVGSQDPTMPWHAPWAEWLAAPSPTWPPDFSKLPKPFAAPVVGEWPEIEGMPHYALPELAGSTTQLELADPGALIALALWHAGAARLAAGDAAAAVDTFGARYLWPSEPRPTAVPALPLELIFGSDYLVPEDGAFLADLTGTVGAAAVDQHKATSLLAAIADASRVNGKIDPERAVDVAVEVKKGFAAAMLKANAEQEDASHRTFSEIAEVAALRALALVAEAEGDREVSGILRINSMEKSDGATACPSGLLSLAAWDTRNRYPARASDIILQFSRRYGSLEAARYGLDVLALRVSRERTQLPPGM